MFDNIGRKIKGLAKFICWIGIIGCVIGGIIMISQGNALNRTSDIYGQGASLVTSGIFLIIAGSIGSWLGSLVLYGFGELIERIVSIDNKLGKNASRSNRSGKQPYNAESEPEQTKEDRPVQVCELCGMECEKLTPIKVETRKGTKTKNVCVECLRAREKSPEAAKGSIPAQMKAILNTSGNEDKESTSEEIGAEQIVQREEIGIDGKCCICGVKMETNELKEWSNKKILIRSCEDCRKLLITVNDEWTSERKKLRAKQELQELLDNRKVSQAVEPYIKEFISDQQ